MIHFLFNSSFLINIYHIDFGLSSLATWEGSLESIAGVQTPMSVAIDHIWVQIHQAFIITWSIFF